MKCESGLVRFTHRFLYRIRLQEEKNAHVLMSCVCRISILNESELHRLTATEQTNALMKSTNETQLYFPDGNAELEALPGDISIVYSIRPIQTNAYFVHPCKRVPLLIWFLIESDTQLWQEKNFHDPLMLISHINW